MILVTAVLAAPLAAITDDDQSTFHRVNMDGLPMADWDSATHSMAVCGAAVKLIATDAVGAEPVRWEWLRTRGTPYKRCQTCNGRRA